MPIRKVKVLHLVGGELNGGAARGAYWLHKGLLSLGVDSLVITNSRETFFDNSVVSTRRNLKGNVVSMLNATIDQLPLNFYKNRKKAIFSTGLLGFDFLNSSEYKSADIVHLHWINGGLVGIRDLTYIKKPVVWTLRDMWPFTGGCHYSLECHRYEEGCGYCPQLGSRRKYDLSKYVFSKKKNMPMNIKIIGISNWLSGVAKESLIFKGHDVRTISNNVNTNEFFPIDKRKARDILGVQTQKYIVVAGANSLGDFYKGLDKLLEAIGQLDRERYYLCFFGKLDEKLISELGFEYSTFGYLNDVVSMRLLYSAGDVFVAPSLMEAFGKTLVESMSCETPVVCFDAMGPRDIVDHKKNGFCASPFDALDLARGIEWVAGNSVNLGLGKSAREKAVRSFDSHVIAEKYLELYDEMLNAQINC